MRDSFQSATLFKHAHPAESWPAEVALLCCTACWATSVDCLVLGSGAVFQMDLILSSVVMEARATPSWVIFHNVGLNPLRSRRERETHSLLFDLGFYHSFPFLLHQLLLFLFHLVHCYLGRVAGENNASSCFASAKADGLFFVLGFEPSFTVRNGGDVSFNVRCVKFILLVCPGRGNNRGSSRSWPATNLHSASKNRFYSGN